MQRGMLQTAADTPPGPASWMCSLCSPTGRPVLGLCSVVATLKSLVIFALGSGSRVAGSTILYSPLYLTPRHAQPLGINVHSIPHKEGGAGPRPIHLEEGSILVLPEVLLARMLPWNPEHGLSFIIPAHPWELSALHLLHHPVPELSGAACSARCHPGNKSSRQQQ